VGDDLWNGFHGFSVICRCFEPYRQNDLVEVTTGEALDDISGYQLSHDAVI